MNYKKLSKFVCTILLVSLFLGGCSSSTTSEKKETNHTDKEGSSSEVVNLEFTSWRTEDADVWENIIKKFNESYPDIHITFKPIKNTEYDAQTKIMLQSGEGADLLFVRAFDAGRILMETDYLAEVTEERIPALKKEGEGVKSPFAMEDGRLFALPGAKVVLGNIYNKKIFDKYNLEEPKTWDEFFEVCETLKSNGVRPLALGFKDGWTIAHRSFQTLPSMIDGNAEKWRSELYKGERNFLDEAFIKHLEIMNKLKDYAGDDFQGVGYVDTQQLFLSEQAAIFPGGSFEISYFRKTNPNLELGVFATPSENENNITPVAITPSYGYAVNKNSKHVDEAFTFLNWLTTKEAVDVYMEGLVGLPPMVPSSIDINDELMNKWLGFMGDDGSNMMVYWGFDKLNANTPGGPALIGEAVQRMWIGEFTEQQAAEFVQEGISSWYEPLK